jgi:hypothetical protein
MYPLIVARQRLRKNPPIAARQHLDRNVTAVTNTHATIELLDASFQCGQFHTKESRRLVLPRTCFVLYAVRVVSKTRRRSVLPITSCILYDLTSITSYNDGRKWGDIRIFCYTYLKFYKIIVQFLPYPSYCLKLYRCYSKGGWFVTKLTTLVEEQKWAPILATVTHLKQDRRNDAVLITWHSTRHVSLLT